MIPTLHARVDDVVYVHGSAASRTLRALGRALPVCLTVTLIDGIVLARKRPDPWPHVFGYWEIFHAFVVVAAALQYCAIAFVVLPLGE